MVESRPQRFVNLPRAALFLDFARCQSALQTNCYRCSVVFAPFFIALAILLALSFGTLFAALNVRFCDVKFALPFALRIWMFISPIFYPASILSEKWRVVFALNPLIGILEGFRHALFGGEFDWFAVSVSVVMAMILMVLSVFVFKRMEDDFAGLI